jgi:hypothetical protein
MSTKRTALLMALALSLMLVLANGCSASFSQREQLKTTTLLIQRDAQAKLDNLDHDMSVAASQLSGTGLSGAVAKQVLSGLVGKHPFVIDYATADTAGNMVTLIPEVYNRFQGSYIGTENVRQPVLSPMLRAVEGMDAVALIWPIFSERGDFMGTLSALFKPEALFSTIVEPGITETDISLNVIQLDGLTIYDSQYLDTGKNLLTDPEFQPYEDLVALGNKMVSHESGSGSYTFIDRTTGQSVKKLACWASVGLHGTEWRVICAEQASK